MTSSDWPSINPYQAPAEVPPPTADNSLTDELRSTLAAFRQQIHAIGGAWIVFGVFLLMFVPTVSLGASPSRDAYGNIREGNVVSLIAGIIVAALGIAWILAGIGTCWKSRPGAYVGLAISYFVLLGLLMIRDPCSSVILIIVLIQAHRVLRWAKQLTAAGIPLTAKP
ncbi:MAG TPA: hypothetical protein VMP01_23075 [Pirellulaceae bacterium]|nr:hypothetical protein [Pirellulaceae bacterium]